MSRNKKEDFDFTSWNLSNEEIFKANFNKMQFITFKADIKWPQLLDFSFGEMKKKK